MSIYIYTCFEHKLIEDRMESMGMAREGWSPRTNAHVDGKSAT